MTLDFIVSDVETHAKNVLEPFAKSHNLTFHLKRASGQEYHSGHYPAYGNLTATTMDMYLEPAPISPISSKEYQILSRTISTVFSNQSLVESPPRDPFVVLLGIMPANTDTRHYWNLTSNIFRFSPHGKRNRSGGVHTVNEKLYIPELVNGVEFFYQLIRSFE